MKAGYLWVNTYGGIIPETPYGGFKQSGIGKELGAEGIDNYPETKMRQHLYRGKHRKVVQRVADEFQGRQRGT